MTRLLSFAASLVIAATAIADVDFTKDVKPILSNSCFACHGPDEAERHGGIDGLRLDTLEGARADLGDGSQAIVPGDPDSSMLLQRIASDDESLRMPPADVAGPLSPEQQDILRRWIAQGAPYAPHWAYQAPVRQPAPVTTNDNWSRNEIDRFLQARMHAEGLSPSAEADRNALIRRVTLDLTGLSPTPEEVDAFLNDSSPNAYEQLVDRLLASDAFGEHWARMWLDLARYADSAGYADDPPRTIWAYRDWVIRAFNRNMPFDQFTIEQIAGDLLENPTEDQLIATAFHRNTLTNNEGGTDDEEFRNVAIVDRTNTTMEVWMATTMSCAQCHTHKYDPITQEEYFRFFAFFNNTADADRRDESPFIEIFTDEQLQQKSRWEAELAQLRKTLTTPTPELLADLDTWAAEVSTPLAWTPLVPSAVRTSSQHPASVDPQSAIITTSGDPRQETVDVAAHFPRAARLTGLRLHALTADHLPNKGPGHAGGNFVVSRVAASVEPPQGTRLTGRYLRIEIPGPQKILSLAEVQIFSGSTNVALGGVATQSSTAYEGGAKLAIDGNTRGEYYADMSTTHTAQSDNPWWDIDLQTSHPLDRISLWNRTDNKLHTRLSGFRIALLDENRSVVWEEMVTDPPNPNREFSLSGARTLPLKLAFADFTQQGFHPQDVLTDKAADDKGWAIAGSVGQPHHLTLIPEHPVDIPAGATLTVRIEQQSKYARHTLGRFALHVTEDEAAADRAGIPADVMSILQLATDDRSPDQQQRLVDYHLSIAPPLDDSRARVARLEQQLASIKPYTTVPVLRELPANQQRETRIQLRGNYLATDKVVSPATPSAFPSPPRDAPLNRLTLARWLVSRDNPLTARVMVNRLWEKIFGRGIVLTSEDFGSQGDLPVHPELLDWLAVDFMENGWDVKRLLRQMVLSAAYRQSSRVSPEEFAADPDNRFLARGPRFRLTAEMVRDQALAVSGLLSTKMYGPPVRPPQPAMGLSAAFGSSTDWKTSEGEDRYRRAIYITWRRSNPYPSMSAFDAPNREVCTIRRDRTNTPLQAFVTLNDPVYVEASQALGRRMAAHSGDRTAQIEHGFRICVSRPPAKEETARLLALFEATRKSYAADAQAATSLATDPLGPLPEGSDPAEMAAWTVVGNVLLSLDEMLMKR